ncbi:MAG: hypothetical protein R3E32_03920 [Chitinophagales bacterium]
MSRCICLLVWVLLLNACALGKEVIPAADNTKVKKVEKRKDRNRNVNSVVFDDLECIDSVEVRYTDRSKDRQGLTLWHGFVVVGFSVLLVGGLFWFRREQKK